MLDTWTIWCSWLAIALCLLIIACGVFMKRNLRGFRPDMRYRLACILIGMGLLFSSTSSLLMQAGQPTWPTVDRHILSWIEVTFIAVGLGMELAAIRILAQYRDQLRSRVDAGQRQA